MIYNLLMKIYLIRHGQTTGDTEDRFGGDYEDHLTAEGKRQADQLAQKLITSGIQKIYVSPRIRAKETWIILSNQFAIPLITIENLKERNHYGVMTGMIKSEAKLKYPAYIELLKDTKNTIEGGEDYESFKKRVTNTFSEIIKENSNLDSMAIISHGGVIRLVFREILKIGEIDINDCAFTKMETSKNKLKVLLMDGIEILK